jgi:hypothetical protein
MPARHHILAIVAFWVATTGWLCYRDIWPRLWPGEPPPFTIDLVDEASEQKVFWTILQEGDVKGYAQTWVMYHPSDNTFDIAGLFKYWSQPREQQNQPDRVMESRYRVTPEGELRRLSAEVTATLAPPFQPSLTVLVEAKISGPVANHRFSPHARLNFLEMRLERDFPPVEVSRRGSVLNPLQPLNKLRGLRPGQRWRIPFVDPLEDTLRAVAPSLPGLNLVTSRNSELEAEVLPQVLPLPALPLVAKEPPLLPRRSGDPCLVIQLSGEDTSGRVWVRETDTLVLRQEITHQGVPLTLDRD